MRRGRVSALLLSGAGCFSNSFTPFDPTLAPLEANTAGRPALGEIVLTSGHGSDSDGDYDWVHARARFDASPDHLFACLQEGAVVADRRQVDDWGVVPSAAPEDPDEARMIVRHEVHHPLTTVRFEVTWRLQRRDREAGTHVRGRFQKTWGSNFISRLVGSVGLEHLDDGTTELAWIEHLSAAQSSEDRIRQYARDVYDNLVAHARGEPLPEF